MVGITRILYLFQERNKDAQEQNELGDRKNCGVKVDEDFTFNIIICVVETVSDDAKHIDLACGDELDEKRVPDALLYLCIVEVFNVSLS